MKRPVLLLLAAILGIALVTALPTSAQYASNPASLTTTVKSGQATDTQGVAAAQGLRLVGVAMTESAGSAAVATFILRNGTTASDPIIFPGVIELNPNESTREWFQPGIRCENGIFIDRVAGTADIILVTTTE